MERNFIILYVAREGSSAIVSRLSLHQNIAVPAFEELDKFWLDRISYSGKIEDAIDFTYRNKKLPFGEDRLFKKFIPRHPNGEESCCGFKWRPHGSLLKLVRTLKNNNVHVFFLYRRNILELTSSLYITNSIMYPGTNKKIGHYQFRMSKMTPEESEAFKRFVMSQAVTLEKGKFLKIMIKRIIWALYFSFLKIWLQLFGVRTKKIYYEDFQQGPQLFFKKLFEEIGINSNFEIQSGSKFSKNVKKSSLERIKNSENIIDSIFVQALSYLYRKLVT